MRFTAFIFTAALCLVTPLAHAQAPTAMQAAAIVQACSGSVGTVRVSTIKPGQMSLYLQAVEAQAAWYKSHGLTEHIIYAARIADRDAAPGTMSETQAMSFHFNALSGQMVPPDDAYRAFVKMYNDSSTVTSEYRVCTTKKL